MHFGQKCHKFKTWVCIMYYIFGCFILIRRSEQRAQGNKQPGQHWNVLNHCIYFAARLRWSQLKRCFCSRFWSTDSSHLTCWYIFLLPPISLSNYPVLPVLLPAGYAGSDCVHQDMLVSEGTAAHPGCGGVSGPLHPCFWPKVQVLCWPGLQ